MIKDLKDIKKEEVNLFGGKATNNATTLLRDGDEVEVDATNGTVKIIR